ncbi:hypothetical protein C8Q77DRAFT_410142 [Trametes polyzona]|nr:hypothetical protein C8Q77DRAFT_410142 [Trametes polyzona]
MTGMGHNYKRTRTSGRLAARRPDTRCEGRRVGPALSSPLLGCRCPQIRSPARIPIRMPVPLRLRLKRAQQTPATHVASPTAHPHTQSHSPRGSSEHRGLTRCGYVGAITRPKTADKARQASPPTRSCARGESPAEESTARHARVSANIYGRAEQRTCVAHKRPISAFPSCTPAIFGARLSSARPR